MNKIETIRLILTLISGVCWTVVYIDGIRLGFKHRSYAIPFYALALNFSWELIYTYYGFSTTISAQAVVNAFWLIFDIGILVTYFKFGAKYFPRRLPGNPLAIAGGTDKTLSNSTVRAGVNGPPMDRAADHALEANHRSSAFIAWSVLGLLAAFLVELAFRMEFGVRVGAGYSAFSQNLLMSVLFISMLVKRGSAEGQSMTIAVSKWLGTLAPTILFGMIGETGFPNGSFLIVVLGLLCSVFDLIYIWMLRRTIRLRSVT
jgi:hypothetical protein